MGSHKHLTCLISKWRLTLGSQGGGLGAVMVLFITVDVNDIIIREKSYLSEKYSAIVLWLTFSFSRFISFHIAAIINI